MGTSLAAFWHYFSRELSNLVLISPHFHQIPFDPWLTFRQVSAVVRCLLSPLLEHIVLPLSSYRWLLRGLINLSLSLLLELFCSVDLTMAFADNNYVWIFPGSTTHKRFFSQSPSISESLWGDNLCCSTATVLPAYTWCLYPTSRDISRFRQLIICCSIFKFIPWVIIKSTPMITSSKCRQQERRGLRVGYRHLCLCFWVDGGRLSNSCPKPYTASHFSFTTSGLMIDWVAPMSIVCVVCHIWKPARRKVVVVLLHHWYWDFVAPAGYCLELEYG